MSDDPQDSVERRLRRLEIDNAVTKEQLRFLARIATIALGVGLATLITVLLK